jgi:hypothetical protein
VSISVSCSESSPSSASPPLVSAGGTALLTTLFAIGVVLSVARDPEASVRAAARAQARRRPIDRTAGAMTTYLLAGGGTAGHVNPLLAVADRLREANPDDEVLVLGTAEGSSPGSCPSAATSCSRSRRSRSRAVRTARPWRSPSRFRRSIDDVRSIIEERGVDVVVGFGGYVATPAYLAARRADVPVAIHEANAKPGLANRLGSRWAAGVGVAFGGTPLKHAEVVGMPLRREIEVLDRAASATEAGALFGSTRAPGPARDGRLARRAAHQPHHGGERRGRSRPPAGRCCTSRARRPTSRTPACPTTAWSSTPTAWTSRSRSPTSPCPARARRP